MDTREDDPSCGSGLGGLALTSPLALRFSSERVRECFGSANRLSWFQERRIDNDTPIACRHQIRLRHWCRIPHPPKWPGTTSARHPSYSGAHLPNTALGCSSNHCASLSAYSLPRSLTHSVLSGCCGAGSTAHCSGVAVIRVAGRANCSGGYGRSACAIDALLAAKVSIAAMRIPTAAATTLSSRSGVLACFSAQQHARLIGSNSKGVEPVFTKRLCSCRN